MLLKITLIINLILCGAIFIKILYGETASANLNAMLSCVSIACVIAAVIASFFIGTLK